MYRHFGFLAVESDTFGRRLVVGRQSVAVFIDYHDPTVRAVECNRRFLFAAPDRHHYIFAAVLEIGSGDGIVAEYLNDVAFAAFVIENLIGAAAHAVCKRIGSVAAVEFIGSEPAVHRRTVGTRAEDVGIFIAEQNYELIVTVGVERHQF